MFITLLGRPGSGKTTLGKALEDATELRYVGGGELLRVRVRERRPGWERADTYLKTRTNAPPDVQLELLQDALRDKPIGAILDGFPKTAALRSLVEDALGEPITLAVYLDAPAEVASYRVSHRLVCDDCGRPTVDLEHPENGPCPVASCGGKLARREEDRGVSHARETTDSVALRDDFGRLNQLLTIPGGTTVAQRVEAVVRELESRRKDFPSNSGDYLADEK